MSDLPVQPSLRRLRQFGIRPNRDLGQNFLIDSNLLDVIGRAAALEPRDVVLEVGGGLGVLSEYLADRTAHVHVVELDRRLEPPLRDALDAHPNATLHLADAVKLDFAALDPAPNKVVANLPYGVAAGVILRTIELLPGATTWVAMVQKEVGERLAAGAGSPAYGVPSVVAQLACDVRVLRPVARSVFHPVPNVDSVLVGLTRRGPAPEPALRALVQQGFAHRRKALARSVSLAPAADAGVRDQVRAALEAMGHPPDARAESLEPEAWRELHDRLRGFRPPESPRRRGSDPLSHPDSRGLTPLMARAPGKVNLSLFVGAPREDGLHPLVSVVQPVTLADELTLEPGGEVDEVRCPGVDGPNLAGRALSLFREATGWDAPPQRLTIVKRVPVAAGMGGGSADAAAALRLAARAAGGVPPELLHELGATLGADVPALLAGGRVLMTGAGEHVYPLPEPDPFALVIVTSAAGLSTPDVYRKFDRLGRTRTRDELDAREAEARAGEPPPAVNDLEPAARALDPAVERPLADLRAAGASAAMVSGSGPTVFGLFPTLAAARDAAAATGGLAAEPAGAAFNEIGTA